MQNSATKRGFTLLELSIVLIIIGLIVGGIIEGKSLIRAAQMRAVEKDYRRYLAAFNNFEAKYHALPGDMANADQFWPLASGTPATCRAAASTAATTCDGDGSGTIDATIDSGVTGSEMYHAWKQLQLAGLIEGRYTGHDVSTGGSDIYNAKAGTDVPASGPDNGGFSVMYKGYIADNSDTWLWQGEYGHLMQYKLFSNTGNPDGGAILTPAELQTIDTKIDDGLAATGTVRGNKPNTGWLCTTTGIPSTTQYNLSNLGYACLVDFTTGF